MEMIRNNRIKQLYYFTNFPFQRIGGVMVSELASSVVYRGFELRSGQTKDHKIGICWFSAMHNKEKQQRLVGSESE